ncbi:Pka-C1, partial [Symbiodinium natans]
ADLRELGLLGTGGFGSVTLQEHCPTGERYALKAVSIGQVEHLQMESYLLREVDVPRRLRSSSFVVSLVTTFRDAENVYLLLEVQAENERRQHRAKVGDAGGKGPAIRRVSEDGPSHGSLGQECLAA